MADPVGTGEKLLLYERIGQLLLKTAPVFVLIEGYELSGHIRSILDNGFKHLNVLLNTSHTDIGSLETDLGKPFLNTFLGLGLNLNLDHADQGMKDAWDRLARMIGFAIALPYAATAISMLGKFLFGERFSESVGETLGKLPEEFGLSWALGSMLDTLLERAIGVPLEELANISFRPARLEWPQIRVLLRAHAIDHETYVEKLRLMGFTEHDITHMGELDRTLLSIGDLQQLWRYGLMHKQDVHNYLTRLGYHKQDADHLITLYIDKAKSQFDTLYRSTARHEAELRNITVAQYREVLEAGALPADEVDDDIKALQLELDNGRVALSLATIKARYLHGAMTRHDAHQALLKLGYDWHVIYEIIDTWKYPAATREKSLSAAQVLSYRASGLLSYEDTYNRLIALGYGPADATFLATNPKAHPGAHTLSVTHGTAIQAYIDGVYDYDQLSKKLVELGAKEPDLTTLLKTAQYRLEHAKGHPGVKLDLNQANIIAAFKYGIFDRHTAHDRLVQLGHSTEDATILLEISNRGIFDDVPPLFPTLESAIAYLQNLGFTIHTPPDPHLGAAEGMVLGAGYSYDLPKVPVPVP